MKLRKAILKKVWNLVPVGRKQIAFDRLQLLVLKRIK